MTKREIILDFTSLLDVVLILLFFFILFSHFETNELQASMQEEQAQIVAEYDALSAEVEEKLDEAEKFLDEAKQSDERAVQNIIGIGEFSSGRSMKIKLNMSSGKWTLDIYSNDKKTHEIKSGNEDAMVSELLTVFDERGYDESDTILCEFVYNASEGGTASAYKQTKEIFENLKEEYPHLFISETDMSMFEEE